MKDRYVVQIVLNVTDRVELSKIKSDFEKVGIKLTDAQAYKYAVCIYNKFLHGKNIVFGDKSIDI